MGLFGKRKSRDDIIADAIADEGNVADEGKKGSGLNTGDPKVDIEFTKLHAQLDAMAEVRKSNSERFTRVSEQLGELRGMVVDANKATSKIEVAATKATDLVESVHPEKLMIEVRRQDGKIEALRAGIESNDTIMKDIMGEMRKMRDQMNFYKGAEQVVKLNEEVKQELANIKKMEVVVERHADRVETIFLEVEKKFTSFEKFDAAVQDLQEGFKKIASDFEKLKAVVGTKEDKKEFVDLLDKFNNFEKHTTNLLKLLDDRSRTVKREVETEFAKLRKQLLKDVNAEERVVDDTKSKAETLESESEKILGEMEKEEKSQKKPEPEKPGFAQKLKEKLKDKTKALQEKQAEKKAKKQAKEADSSDKILDEDADGADILGGIDSEDL